MGVIRHDGLGASSADTRNQARNRRTNKTAMHMETNRQGLCGDAAWLMVAFDDTDLFKARPSAGWHLRIQPSN